MTEKINLAANLVAIAKVLAAHGIHQVASTYSGSGDSGDEFNQTAYDANGDEVDLPDVEVVCEHRSYEKVGASYGYVVRTAPVRLSTAIDDATSQAIDEAGHSGYENNEGGKGTLTIFASGYAELDHVDYVDGESDSETFEFGADSVFGKSLAAMAEVMKKHGCSEVQGEYTGSGDSGDGFDISYLDQAGHHADVDSLDDEVTYLVIENVFENGKFKQVASPRTADFEQALEDICFAMVSASGHDGWENNEGGGGTLTVKADGTAVLKHYDNGEDDEVSDSATWNDELMQEGDEALCEAE